MGTVLKRVMAILVVVCVMLCPCLVVESLDLGSYDWAGFKGEVNIGYGNHWRNPPHPEINQVCKEQCFLFFTDVMGMTDESACGILGNMDLEGGFDPTTTEGRKPWAETLPYLGGSGGGLGLVGFTDQSVMKPLGDMAVEYDVPWTDLDLQLNAIADMLPGVVATAETYNYIAPKITSWEDYKASTSVKDCCLIFLYGYERCQGYSTQAVMDKRVASAQEMYEEMKEKGISGTQYEAKNNPKEVYNGVQINKDHNAKGKKEKHEQGSARTEWDTTGMPQKTAWMETGTPEQKLTTTSDLTVAEKLKFGNIQDSIVLTERTNRANFMRQLIAMAGLLLCLYSMFLLVAYLFDINNPFINISLVTIMTFGLYHPKYPDKAVGGLASTHQVFHQGGDTRKILSMVVFTMVLGILLCTGAIGVYLTRKLDLINQVADGLYQFYAGF